MKPRRFYESARVPEITAIVQEGRFNQMVACLVTLGERAAVAAARALEAAREAAKKKPKRRPKKPRARRE